MTRHHTGGVFSASPYGPKPWASRNLGRHWGVLWEEDPSQLERVTDRRGRTRKIRRMVPVRTRSRYIPHIGDKQRRKSAHGHA